MIFINSAFTQDAGCPIFPMEYMNDIQNAATDLDFSFLDLNLDLYYKVGGCENYGYLKSLFGGYTVSYSKAKKLPLNTYRFEALPTLKLLICLLNSKSLTEDFLLDTINETCKEYGMDYDKVYSLLLITNKILDDFSDEITDNQVFINMPSISSVFAGIWLAKKIKGKNSSTKVTGIGNQINVPEVANFAKDIECIDFFINSRLENRARYSLIEILSKLKDKSDEYPLYYGLKIVPYELSYGCPSKCNFCTERLIWSNTGRIKDQYEIKNVDECIREIQFLIDEFGVSGITFNDCMINLKLPKYKKLVDYLLKSNLFLSGSIRIDILDEDMLDLLEKLNFTNLIIGLETLNKDAVTIYNKGNTNYTNNAWNIIPQLINIGIEPQINLIIGHPYESEEDVLKSVSQIKEFANYIKQMNIPLVDISVGEILINYPADTYFKVLQDDSFKIIYHNVPNRLEKLLGEKVLDSINKIPFKALKNKESHINKNQLLNEVLSIKSVDTIERTDTNLKVLYKHNKKLLNEWKKFNIVITAINKFENPHKNTNFRVINELIKNDGCVSINDLLSSDDSNEDIVKEILVLILLGIIDLEAKNCG